MTASAHSHTGHWAIRAQPRPRAVALLCDTDPFERVMGSRRGRGQQLDEPKPRRPKPVSAGALERRIPIDSHWTSDRGDHVVVVRIDDREQVVVTHMGPSAWGGSTTYHYREFLRRYRSGRQRH